MKGHLPGLVKLVMGLKPTGESYAIGLESVTGFAISCLKEEIILLINF
jgi:hypothetical protein